MITKIGHDGIPPRNTKLTVRSDHPFHPNRIGYFQFWGGPDADCVVMTDVPMNVSPNGERWGVIYYSVNASDIVEDY